MTSKTIQKHVDNLRLASRANHRSFQIIPRKKLFLSQLISRRNLTRSLQSHHVNRNHKVCPHANVPLTKCNDVPCGRCDSAVLVSTLDARMVDCKDRRVASLASRTLCKALLRIVTLHCVVHRSPTSHDNVGLVPVLES